MQKTMSKWGGNILGLLLAVNAIWMLASPAGWYAVVPGVATTGPANAHFIRDIGCAYLATAIALLWFARAPKQAWPAALAGGGFLALHAIVHIWDMLSGREHTNLLAGELLSIFLPAVLALWLALSARGATEKG